MEACTAILIAFLIATGTNIFLLIVNMRKTKRVQDALVELDIAEIKSLRAAREALNKE